MRVLILAVAILALGACGMLAVKGQQAKIDANCRIGGTVAGERKDEVPIVVLLLRQIGADFEKRESWELADHFVLESAGPWQFAASPGTYGLAAFQDLNRDFKHQPSEPFLRIEKELLIACQAGERRTDVALRIPAAGRSRLNETLDIAALQVRSVGEQMETSLSEVTAVGMVTSLSDSRFDEAVALDGLWRPFDFLFKAGPGVYFLQPYDAKKIPVLFVHGINGSPQNFKTLIERLDHERYQPWVYYYPSGASLAMVADHLAQTMNKLRLQYGFNRFAVVAHSMGGLVSRGFLHRYKGASVPLFVSISTPWDGHKSAESGVKHSPVVVRVWIDMAPDSEYLRSIYAKELGIPHYLLFGFKQTGMRSGESTDGTVTVASQLRPAAQQAAVRVEGYNETHMGVLESEAVSQRLNALLVQHTR